MQEQSMSVELQRHVVWVDKFLRTRYPDLVTPYLKALEVGRLAQSQGLLSPDGLQVLLEGARSARKPLGEGVANILGVLANQFSVAKDGIRRLAADPVAQSRSNVFSALSAHHQSEIHEEVLGKLLCDTSGKIRRLAAEKIMLLGLSALLPAIERTIAAERNGPIRSALIRTRNLLRDGMDVEKRESGQLAVTTRRPDGGLVTEYLTADELSRRHRQ